MKNIKTTLLATAALGLAALTLSADDHDKFTRITVNETVQLPNLTLQPGNYTLKLLESSSNRNIVQVADANGKNLAIILALPNYRLIPRETTTIQYWETSAGQPKPIRAWFFPGDNFGQEFVYPKTKATEIAAYNHTTVATMPDSATDLKTARVEDFDDTNSRAPSSSTTTTAANATPAPSSSSTDSLSVDTRSMRETTNPTPQVLAQVNTPSASSRTSTLAQSEAPTTSAATTESPVTELPRTASNLPLMGLVGVASLAGFLALSRKRRVQ